MEYSIFDKIQNSGWSLWNHQQKLRHEFISINNELQSISRQIMILKFFSKNIKHIPSRYSTISFENAMKQKPVTFLEKFSTHQYIYVHDYLVKIILYPKTMSSLLGNFFTKDCLRLHYFARVTFPSLYHNFITEELHKAGASLVKRIIQNQPYFLTKAFMLSFIEFSSDFFISLWSTYEQMENDFKEKNKNDNNEHPDSLISIFLISLSKSLTFLSKSQIKLFQILLNRSENDFGTIILHTMFPNSFFEYFHYKINEPKKSAIYQMLITASFYPNSPFFKKIVKTVTSPVYTKIRPSHKESGFMNKTPIVLSLHELLLLQQIIFSTSKSKSKYSKSEKDPNSEKNENSEILNNNKILTYEKKLGVFVFSAELCKSNFDPLIMDLNLNPLLAKVKNPTEISIFPNKQKIGNENQSQIQTQNFINNFNGYLAVRYIEKVYKKAIHDKKLELFIIIGIYSKKCIDHSMTDRKSSSLFLPNTFNIMQSSNSITIPADSLNFINVSIPTSLSINSIYQADYTLISETENNDNNDDEEKKVQKVIKLLDLPDSVKEKVHALIGRFESPNDELSMFILIQQLDIIKIHSKSKPKKDENEEEESKNEEMDLSELNEDDSLSNFKEKIEKLKESSEKSLKKIDKNGCFHKYVKICADKIDNLAEQDHFKMIFGLIIIGFELNEIAVQLSKSKSINQDLILNKMRSFFNLVFSNSSGKMVDVFIWYHKFVSIFPEIKKVIPKKPRFFINFLVDYFNAIFNSNEENE